MGVNILNVLLNLRNTNKIQIENNKLNIYLIRKRKKNKKLNFETKKLRHSV